MMETNKQIRLTKEALLRGRRSLERRRRLNKAGVKSNSPASRRVTRAVAAAKAAAASNSMSAPTSPFQTSEQVPRPGSQHDHHSNLGVIQVSRQHRELQEQCTPLSTPLQRYKTSHQLVLASPMSQINRALLKSSDLRFLPLPPTPPRPPSLEEEEWETEQAEDSEAEADIFHLASNSISSESTSGEATDSLLADNNNNNETTADNLLESRLLLVEIGERLKEARTVLLIQQLCVLAMMSSWVVPLLAEILGVIESLVTKLLIQIHILATAYCKYRKKYNIIKINVKKYKFKKI